jgi:hypothetical protein
MRMLPFALALVCLALAAPAAEAGGLRERIFGRKEQGVVVEDGHATKTTQHFDGAGRLRKVVVDESFSRAGVRRVKTERFRKDGSLAARTIDTKVDRVGGGLDHDVWHQGFGKDGAVKVDFTLGQVGGKISAYVLAGARRFGTKAEIHWDKQNLKLRYVAPTP